jgi:hypothetical protein
MHVIYNSGISLAYSIMSKPTNTNDKQWPQNSVITFQDPVHLIDFVYRCPAPAPVALSRLEIAPFTWDYSRHPT